MNALNPSKFNTATATAVSPHEAFLAERYGPDWREVLQIQDHPHAETDESAFCAAFPEYVEQLARREARRAVA